MINGVTIKPINEMEAAFSKEDKKLWKELRILLDFAFKIISVDLFVGILHIQKAE